MKNFFPIFFATLLITSCSLESKFGLPNDERINTELIGDWYDENDKNGKITILKNSDKTYKLMIWNKDKSENIISYSKTIKGYSIMNLLTKQHNIITNVFYGYKVEGDTLYFYEVNSKLKNKEFISSTELFDFFTNNIDKKDFFKEEQKLIRK